MLHEKLMTGKAVASALIVSGDCPNLAVVQNCLSELSIEHDLTSCGQTAAMLLERKKFEAVILNCSSLQTSLALLRSVRMSTANRNVVTYVMAERGASKFPVESRPNFVIETPVAHDALSRTFHASFGMILRERRRYFRCSLNVATTLELPKLNSIACEMVDISEGGFAINSPVPIMPRQVVTYSFDLSPEAGPQRGHAEVCWCDSSGRVGLRFLMQQESQQIKLHNWLASELEKLFPAHLASRYHRDLVGAGESRYAS